MSSEHTVTWKLTHGIGHVDSFIDTNIADVKVLDTCLYVVTDGNVH